MRLFEGLRQPLGEVYAGPLGGDARLLGALPRRQLDSFIASRVWVDSWSPNIPVKDALRAVSTESLVEKNVTACE
jgi:hypothetical protein